jgi:Family of unknown function (DUF6263)
MNTKNQPNYLKTLLFTIILSTGLLSSNSTILRGDDTSPANAEVSQTAATTQNSATNPEAVKKFLFAYKFQANQIIRYSVMNSSSVNSVKGDFSETNTNESNTKMHYRVVSVDSGNHAILEPVLDHVKMSAIFADADPITYDSQNNKEIPVQFTGVDKSIGKPLSRFKFNQQGKLLQILDLRNSGKGDPHLTNETNNSVELLGNQNFLIVFPDHPVAVGDKWNEKYESDLKVSESLNQRVKYLRKYQLDSVENNQAVFSLKTVLITRIEDPKLRLQLIQKTPTGKLVFNMQQGIITSRELNTDQTEFGIFGEDSKIKISSKRTENLIR